MYELFYIVSGITFFGCIVSGVEVFRANRRAEIKANKIPFAGAKKLIALFYVVVAIAVCLVGFRLVERIRAVDVFVLLCGLFLSLKIPTLMVIRKIKSKKNAKNPTEAASKSSSPAPQATFRAEPLSDKIHDSVCGVGGSDGDNDDDEPDEDYEDYDRPYTFEELYTYDVWLDDD